MWSDLPIVYPDKRMLRVTRRCFYACTRRECQSRLQSRRDPLPVVFHIFWPQRGFPKSYVEPAETS